MSHTDATKYPNLNISHEISLNVTGEFGDRNFSGTLAELAELEREHKTLGMKNEITTTLSAKRGAINLPAVLQEVIRYQKEHPEVRTCFHSGKARVFVSGKEFVDGKNAEQRDLTPEGLMKQIRDEEWQRSGGLTAGMHAI